MITLDKSRCTKCGKCIKRMENYCISEDDGYPVFDYSLCNICQKCVSICPSQAIMVNGQHPLKQNEKHNISPEMLVAFLEQRRSIKLFKDKKIPPDILRQIVSGANYAPNQNKNLSVHMVTDPEILGLFNKYAFRFSAVWYRILFGFKPVTWFIKIFARKLDIIKKKMEVKIKYKKRGIPENVQAVVIITGNKHVPVTEHSAPYMMASMMYMAESVGVGTCLNDALLITLKLYRKLRKVLNIKEDIFCTMFLGYSAEGIINIPKGYEVPQYWNGEKNDTDNP